MGKHPYRAKQLSHWMFFFRAQGTELDHFYGKYDSRAFLIESTIWIQWWRRDDWQDPFRICIILVNQNDINRCTQSIHALIKHYDMLIQTPSPMLLCSTFTRLNERLNQYKIRM